MHCFKKMWAYSNVSIENCFEERGERHICVRWTDVSKQSDADPTYKSRFVGKRDGGCPMTELHVATPTFQCFRMVISSTMNAASIEAINVDATIRIVCDVSRANPDVPAVRPVDVQIALEVWGCLWRSTMWQVKRLNVWDRGRNTQLASPLLPTSHKSLFQTSGFDAMYVPPSNPWGRSFAPWH